MATLNLTTSTDYSTDFEKAGSRDFDPIPTGWYKANIFSVEIGAVKQGPNEGKPRLKFQFKIADGETSADGKKQGNRRLFVDLNYFESYSEKLGRNTLPFELLDLGKALGKSIDEILNFDTDEWEGQELDLRVRVVPAREQVNGEWVNSAYEKTNKVGGYRSVEAGNTAAAAVAPAGGKSKAGAFKL